MNGTAKLGVHLQLTVDDEYLSLFPLVFIKENTFNSMHCQYSTMGVCSHASIQVELFISYTSLS